MAVPVVTAIAPAAGLPAGGAVVSITGTNMASATAVHFGATDATAFANLSATQVVATAPAGTGTVHVTVTTTGGTSATSGADYFAYTSGLFTVDEARAFDKLQLASVAEYPDADIVAKEAEIRQMFTNVCAVDFIPTLHTDEYTDGYGNSSILLDWPLPTAITSASIRTGTTWTALTVTELAALQPLETGELLFNEGYFPIGRGNVKVTYTAGHASVPALVKDAALKIAVSELPTSNVPFTAESYEGGGMNVSYAEGDGFAGAWSRIADVRRALRLYDLSGPGIA